MSIRRTKLGYFFCLLDLSSVPPLFQVKDNVPSTGSLIGVFSNLCLSVNSLPFG